MTLGRGTVVLQRPNIFSLAVKGTDPMHSNQFNVFHVHNSTDDIWLHTYFLREEMSPALAEYLITCSIPVLLNPRGDTLYSTENIDFSQIANVTVGPITKASLFPVDEWIFMASLRARKMKVARLPFKERRDVVDVFGGGRVYVFPSNGWSVCVESTEAIPNGDSQRLLDLYEDSKDDKIKTLNAFISTHPGQVLKVYCCHNKRKKMYSICRISTTCADTQAFNFNNTPITVAEYFQTRQVPLSRPELPLAVDTRGRFLPLELCHLVSNKCVINYEILGEFFETLRPFGIKLDFKLRPGITFRQTKASSLALPDRSKEMPSCLAWLVRVGEHDSSGTKSDITECFKSKNLDISFTNAIGIANMEDWETQLKLGLTECSQNGGPCDIIIIVSDSFLPRDVYCGMKKIFDMKLGIASQVLCLDRFCEGKDNGAFVRELVNQIIIKVSPAIRPVRSIGQRRPPPSVNTALVGVWTETVPGVPGTVIRGYSMSVDMTIPHNRFVHRVNVAPMKSHEPDDISVYELLMSFFDINGHFPTRIIVYTRARSSMAKFRQIAADLGAWNNAINRINRELRTKINPKFQEFEKDEIKPNLTLTECERIMRLQPGSIIDDPTLLETGGMNFYIHAHGAKLATHYRTIHDQNGFTLNEFENYTFDMCTGTRGFPICLNVSKKLVERMKLYVEAELDTIKGIHSDPSTVCEFLNQSLCSEYCSMHPLYASGRSCFI